MNYITIERAQKNYENIVAKNEANLNAIRARIDQRTQAGLDHKDLDQELSTARTVAERTEAFAQKALDKAKEDAAIQKAKTDARIQANQEKAEKKLKILALREYLKNGGSSSDFEKAWPDLRKKMLENATLEGVAEAGKDSQTSVRSL